MKFIALIVVILAIFQMVSSSYIDRKIERETYAARRVFAERTRHMTKAQLKRLGFCTIAITALGPFLKPLFYKGCKAGFSWILNFLKTKICSSKVVRKYKKESKCKALASWIQGQWSKYGATGCSALW